MCADSHIWRRRAGRKWFGADGATIERLREVEMPKHQRLVLTIVVFGASFVPAATAMAGMNLGNHNETLLLDT
jgi:hypothetical protein